MQLTYRGFIYKTSSNQANILENQTACKYRGISYKIEQNVETTSTESLKYRGIIYFLHK